MLCKYTQKMQSYAAFNEICGIFSYFSPYKTDKTKKNATDNPQRTSQYFFIAPVSKCRLSCIFFVWLTTFCSSICFFSSRLRFEKPYRPLVMKPGGGRPSYYCPAIKNILSPEQTTSPGVSFTETAGRTVRIFTVWMQKENV